MQGHQAGKVALAANHPHPRPSPRPPPPPAALLLSDTAVSSPSAGQKGDDPQVTSSSWFAQDYPGFKIKKSLETFS